MQDDQNILLTKSIEGKEAVSKVIYVFFSNEQSLIHL
jgi:hypothetical protein